MACSLAGIVAFANAVAAQQGGARPTSLPTNARVSPWPTMPKSPPSMAPYGPSSAAAPPVVYPPGGDASSGPVFASPTVGGVGAGSQPHRTLYYRKDSHAVVKPSPAAEVAVPIAAEQTPMNGGQPMRTPVEPLPAPRPGDSLALPSMPSPQDFFRLESEDGFIRRENVRRKKDREDPKVAPEMKLEDVVFPPHVDTAQATFVPRMFSPLEVQVEPNYVCHRRLFFEDRNSERYGWSMGPFQPLLSSWKFWGDLNALPYRAFSFPCLRHECSAGLCLPGDPVPLMIYPPGLSITGALGQAAVTTALYLIIP